MPTQRELAPFAPPTLDVIHITLPVRELSLSPARLLQQRACTSLVARGRRTRPTRRYRPRTEEAA